MFSESVSDRLNILVLSFVYRSTIVDLNWHLYVYHGLYSYYQHEKSKCFDSNCLTVHMFRKLSEDVRKQCKDIQGARGRVDMSRLMTKPTQWHVRQATGRAPSLRCPPEESLGP